MTRSGTCLPLLVAFTIATSFRLLPVSSCFALSQRQRNIVTSPSLKSLKPHRQQYSKTHHGSLSLLPTLRGGETATTESAAVSSSATTPASAATTTTSTALQSSSTPSEAATTSPPPPPPQPTLRDLVKFALPCLGLWISGPLLSLIDTASVGLTAKPGMGATELGALGPATTFIDGSTYLFAFLNVATTNLYASALAKNADDAEKSKLAGDAVVRTSIKISLICGLCIMTLLFTQGKNLLSLYVGEKASGQILGPATEYVHIRALSLPTSLLAGVLQAALLGSQDSVTPLIAVAASTIINIFGDGMLVVALGMGTAGAALATTLAQWGGTAAMYRPAKNKLIVPSASVSAEDRAAYKVTSRDFLAFAAPVLTLILGKLAAFGVMTHVAAALPGEASLAAHQIILSLFFFVSPFLEVLSQTAQAFLPQFYVVKDDASYMENARRLAVRLTRLGMIVGAGIACVASSIPRFLPFVLTNDGMVQRAVRPLALPLLLGSLLTAPVAVSEGVLLARRELKFLAGVYVLSTLMFPFGLFALKGKGSPVSHVWYGFVFFQMFRAACFTGKLWGGAFVDRIASLMGSKGSKGKGVTA